MKANHNRKVSFFDDFLVVVNINSSKNESKSQLLQAKNLYFLVVVNINSSKNESKSQLSKEN